MPQPLATFLANEFSEGQGRNRKAIDGENVLVTEAPEQKVPGYFGGMVYR